jgi:alpha-mannosidase
MGYRLYRMRTNGPKAAPTRLRTTATSLENDHVRLVLDGSTGRIASLIVKDPGGGLDIIDPGRSRAVVVDDTSDTWGHRRLAYRDEIGSFETAGVELVESGPVRGILRVDSRYGDSRLIEDYILAADGSSIEVRVILDWREHAKLLKLRFATAINDPSATYEIPYGAIGRPPNGEEEPGQRWVDVSGPPARSPASAVAGLAILNDAKYSFDVDGPEIGVTAVRSPIYAHHEPAIPKPGVRYEFQDQGVQRFTLELLPHRGDWTAAGLTRRAALLNARPTVLFESFHDGPLPASGSFLAVEPDHLVVGALKLAEDRDDLVVRIVETVGRPADARVTLPGGRELGFAIGPFEIRTFRVPRDPGADPIETDLLERPLTAS